MKALVLIPMLALTGCLSNPPQMPILTCAGECTYYGPPQENPNVAMAKVLTGGAVQLGLGFVNGSVMKSAFNGNSSSNTIERTTNNTTTDRSSATALSDTRLESRISDTSRVSDTSVSSVSVSDTVSAAP